ncbi:endolytic transglycosylase MltG [Vibrio sp. TRT 17S01]|uniref:endolytic transglycosylase MltG n=1 Tax=Vibrio sp. TRT 17S01 TaxID=3418505 RepID=UPI003CE8A313
MIKKITVLTIAAVLLLVSGYFYVTKQVNLFVNQPLNLAGEQIVTIKPGTSFNRLLVQLSNDQLIEINDLSPLSRRFYPELTGVKAGTYLIKGPTTLRDVLIQFSEGKEHQFSLTFVEGSTFKEWRDALASAPYLQHTIDKLSEKEIAALLGLDVDKLEGMFLAETYHYTNGMSDVQILKRANTQLAQELDSKWEKRQKNLPLNNQYDALILASIIEKETAIASERQRVASVFVNRLNKRMRLQTDPTVIYGMGDKYDGNIRKRDLRTPTPYNTYVIFGLPPTPIAMPGRASIAAALDPEDSNYLYFVASGDGGHVFSKTLAEHNRAVRAYLRKLRSKK